MTTLHNNFGLTSTFNRLFTDFIEIDENRVRQTKASVGTALLNIHETEDSFVLQVGAPGYEKNNFSVVVENEMMIIEAKVDLQVDTAKNKQIRKDFTVANFKKVIHLDRNVVTAPSDASYENGILKITLPKLKKEAVGRTQVQIN